MSSRNIPGGFSLDDFYTRVIPGLVVISPFLIGASISYSKNIPEISTILIVTALASFVAGELIDYIRILFNPVPGPFRRFVSERTDDSSKLTWAGRMANKVESTIASLRIYPSIQRFTEWVGDIFGTSTETLLPVNESLDYDFQAQLESDLGVELNTTNVRDVYDLLLIRLEPHLTTKTRRARTLYVLDRNLKIAAIASIFIYVGIGTIVPYNSLIVFAILTLVVLTGLVYVIAYILIDIQTHYIRMLFKECYLLFENQTP